ncbi:dihydroorotate dehydrogenase electron transfer subunit [Melissococcus plutonius]|uniref:dihydroorotate dehydrogenase electron transfer subunit n=1 Tax=Melissococcus plutonius TaxID=33970 RepID=UPI003C2F90CD
MKQEQMTVVLQKQLAPHIYQMTLTGELVKEMNMPGQFLHIKVPKAYLLLRRPISLNQIDHEKNTCTIIYRTEGTGTKILSTLNADDKLDVMGPLGNGFKIDGVNSGQIAFIVGGGIGIPPLYELSKQLTKRGVHVVHFLGYATKELIYFKEEFMNLGETQFATDDGTYGVEGNVGNLLAEASQTMFPDAIYACGPNGMLKTIVQLFSTLSNIFLSLEERMACGIGACNACVCPVQGDKTGTRSVKVCEDGPVFLANEVVL